MTPRPINRTLIICVCRRPIALQIVPGTTARVLCTCGNVIVEVFPAIVKDRKTEIRKLIDREPANRWEALGFELLQDELNDLEKNS